MSAMKKYDEARDIQSNTALLVREYQRARPKGTLEDKGLYLTVFPESNSSTE